LPSHPHSARHHLHPHSFPTRRSSDLVHLADLNIGYLYVAAVSSIAVYGVALGGWSSNSKYALLGGLRSSAQLISYELAQGLAALDRKSTRLNSSHRTISYAVFCLKKK